MSWMTENLAQVLLVAGLLLLAIEVMVLGFATFFLFFLGVALALTASFMWMGMIPESLLAGALTVSLLTIISALVLWRPLKRMQNTVEVKPVTSDLVGYRFFLKQKIGPNHPGRHAYSGITWSVLAATEIEANTQVEVVTVNVGEFIVKAVD
jgi:membrane protein implicated in regulation of membrane protease activity